MKKILARIGLGLAVLVVVAIGVGAYTLSRTEQCPPPTATSVEGPAMQAVNYHCYGPPEVVELITTDRPQPAADEILVKVHAAAVNPLDWHYMRGSPYIMRLGSGLGKPDDPRLGVDFSGTVAAVGSSVTRFQPGDRVFGGRTGAFAEYLLVPERAAITKQPDNVSFEHGAAVAIAGLTALQALQDKGQLQPGEKVLINGASGGVGSFAVQIAKAMGAEVYGVCSTRNVERVLALGADRVFDYKREDYTQGDHQFDLIVDMVGNHSILRNTGILADDGRMVIVGGEDGDWLGPATNPLAAMLLQPFIDQEISVLMAKLEPKGLETIAGMMADGKVTPLIDRHFTLEETAAAIAYSETGRARGKIIIDIANRDGSAPGEE